MQQNSSHTIDRRTFLAASAAAVGAAAASHGQESSIKYRACVIGDTQHGGYGHNLHQLWTLRDDIEIVGLADPDEEGRKKRGAECGAAKLYADYREMLAKEKPDLVAIGPRTTTRHKEYLLACAEAGAHGILEKPLTPSLAEADEAIAALEAKNLKWAMAFNFRASPVVRHAKTLVDDGLIGQPLEWRSRGKEDHRAGGEDLIVLGVHTLDMANYFFGLPEWCEAEVLNGARPVTPADVREATEALGPIAGDTIHARFGYANGLRGYFDSVKNSDGNQGRWGIDLYGTKGIISIRMAPVPPIALFTSAAWAPERGNNRWRPLPDAPKVEFPEGPVGHYKPIVDDLVESIETDREPFTSIQTGRNAHELIQATFQTCPAHGRVAIPQQQRTHPLNRWKT